MTVATRPSAGPPREYHFPRFERHVLENGLSVIVAPVRKLPVVSVAVVIDAAAVDDPRGLSMVQAIISLAEKAAKDPWELDLIDDKSATLEKLRGVIGSDLEAAYKITNKQQRFNHMPVREGKMECSSCHNPHGSANTKLLNTGTSPDEACTSCHPCRQRSRSPLSCRPSPGCSR